MRWDISSIFKSQKTVHRAAKRPPAGNKKLSKVTSGYGGLMIPLGRIRATPKNGCYMDVAQKIEYFRAKNEPRRLPRRPPCDGFNTKTLPFWCTVMMVTKNLDDVAKDQFFFTLCPYNSFFWPQTDSTQWDNHFPRS